LADLEKASDVTARAATVNMNEIIREMDISEERFSELAQPVLREIDAADSAALKSMKARTEKKTIDVNTVAEQIKTLPYNERSKLIDLAIDANADHLIGTGASRTFGKHGACGGVGRRRCATKRVRLYSRPGNDLTYRFPLIVDALGKLRSRSCIIDGEAVSCGSDGIASFNRIRYRRYDAEVFLYAFDLIELNGDDLRRDPLGVRKATLERLLARTAPGLRFNEHMDEKDGPLVFLHACKLGLEGIVSKRRDSPYIKRPTRLSQTAQQGV
jgi:hypothetical protein